MKSELKLSLQRYQLLFQNTMYRSGKYIPAGVLFLSLQGNQVVNKIDQVSEIVRQFGVGVEVRGIRQPVYQPDQPVNFPLNHKPVDLLIRIPGRGGDIRGNCRQKVPDDFFLFFGKIRCEIRIVHLTQLFFCRILWINYDCWGVLVGFSYYWGWKKNFYA